jgi:serine protease Do
MKRPEDFEDHPWLIIPVPPGREPIMRRWNLALISALVFIVLGVFAMTITPELGHAAAGFHHVPLRIDENPAPVNLANFHNGYASVVDPALPAVVNISSTKVVKQQNEMPDIFSDPFFRQFFGPQVPSPNQPQTEREHSLGSGVIVNPDGYILTNNHVIEGASDVEVFTQNKRKFRARVIGTDSRTDVAVLKIDATQLPSLTLGDSSHLKVGDLVFAVGDPFGVGETATMGIVSATGRGFGGAIEHYEDFIQTDAAINPGNSGGALLDIHGDLIGINTAIITGGGGGNAGVGVAIPINMARNVMEQIVDHSKVVRGQLGVAVQSVDADMAKAFGLAQGGGALVAEVTPDSPAAKAGIQRGDIILELNGQPVNEPDDLSARVSQIAPGTKVHLQISRNGQMRDVDVTLSELPEKAEASAPGEANSAALQGVQVQNLTPGIRQDLGISASTHGVVITSVDPSSAAAAAGLDRGDVIQEINRKPVRDVNEYRQALAEAHAQSVLLLVNRGGSTHYIVVQPQ